MPIIDASSRGDIEQVRKLLKQGTPVGQKDSTGWTALHAAARFGNAAVAMLLLENGANIEAKENRAGGTPLIWAAYADEDEVVGLLLDHGANMNATAADGSTALEMAIHKDAMDTEAVLRTRGATNAAEGPIILAGMNKLGDILLDNREFHPLDDWTVTLNGKYKAHIGYFGARDRLALPASAFKREDGVSFTIDPSRVPKITSEEQHAK